MKRFLFALAIATLTLACNAQGFTDARKFVKEMKRIPGNDSIYYKINTRWYAIKDSVGEAGGAGIDNAVIVDGYILRIYVDDDSIDVPLNNLNAGTFVSRTGITAEGDSFSVYGRETADYLHGVIVNEEGSVLGYLNYNTGQISTADANDSCLSISSFISPGSPDRGTSFKTTPDSSVWQTNSTGGTAKLKLGWDLQYPYIEAKTGKDSSGNLFSNLLQRDNSLTFVGNASGGDSARLKLNNQTLDFRNNNWSTGTGARIGSTSSFWTKKFQVGDMLSNLGGRKMVMTFQDLAPFDGHFSIVDSNGIYSLFADYGDDLFKSELGNIEFTNATTLGLPFLDIFDLPSITKFTTGASALPVVASTSSDPADHATDDPTGFGAIDSGQWYKNTYTQIFQKD